MVAAATLAKQTGAATLLPVVYLLARARGKRGVGGVTLGFAVPTALVALAVGPAQLFYWAVLGNGSYLGVDTASALVVAMFGLMTLGWVACNLPLLWKIPQAWRDRDLPANDGRRDTDLWLWLLSGAVGGGDRSAVLRALLHAAGTAARPARGGCAEPRLVARRARRRSRSRSSAP